MGHLHVYQDGDFPVEAKLVFEGKSLLLAFSRLYEVWCGAREGGRVCQERQEVRGKRQEVRGGEATLESQLAGTQLHTSTASRRSVKGSEETSSGCKKTLLNATRVSNGGWGW